LSDARARSNALAPGPGILLFDVRRCPVLRGRRGSTKPLRGRALWAVRGARAWRVGQGKPKPLEGLLRGTRDDSVLNWLGLGRTTLAPSSCRVWWGVVLAEEARAVVGEGMVGLCCRGTGLPGRCSAACCVQVSGLSVVCALSRVLPRLRRING
jgi:hypothetical protein